MSITIVKSGIQCSIQDLGRWGYQQYGVPVGGVMDRESAITANRLCGNTDNEAVLECTLHGTVITCDETITFALTGGGARATVNGCGVDYNRLIRMVAGSLLKLHPDPQGCRTYIAISGGLQVTNELGSASTYLPSGIGGIAGKNPEAGQQIPLKDAGRMQEWRRDIVIREDGFGVGNWKALVEPWPHVNETVLILCERGPEWDWFNADSQQRFFEAPFIISNHTNRMGFRLEETLLQLKEKRELLSTAVTAGIVQVTNEGHPIILMADAQTIGGYPRIARLTSKAISLLAQCRPGMRLRFGRKCELDIKG
jgi:antagonist of KipI